MKTIEHKTFKTNFTVFPQDTNYHPPMIFGGKMLSMMDICSANCIHRALFSSDTAKDAVTVSVNKVNFYVAAKVGDIVYLEGTIVAVSDKTLTVEVVGYRELMNGTKTEKICDGRFQFCAIGFTDEAQSKLVSVEHGLEL